METRSPGKIIEKQTPTESGVTYRTFEVRYAVLRFRSRKMCLDGIRPDGRNGQSGQRFERFQAFTSDCDIEVDALGLQWIGNAAVERYDRVGQARGDLQRPWPGRVAVAQGSQRATGKRDFKGLILSQSAGRQLDRGILLLKFWLHISKDEQLKRFNERAESAYKHWKLTDEDWRNREQWEQYEIAAHDMVQFTSTRAAPWILVEGDSKHYARVKVLQTLCEALEERVSQSKPV